VLGIVMAVLYLILSLVTFLPTILLGFARGFNVLSLGLTILHVVLAIAVIVLALIPARKILAPTYPTGPSATVEPTAPATPPVASA
jgi:type IV secretory pathway TrbL component